MLSDQLTRLDVVPDVSVHVPVLVHPGDVPGVHRGPGNALTRQTVADLGCQMLYVRDYTILERGNEHNGSWLKCAGRKPGVTLCINASNVLYKSWGSFPRDILRI